MAEHALGVGARGSTELAGRGQGMGTVRLGAALGDGALTSDVKSRRKVGVNKSAAPVDINVITIDVGRSPARERPPQKKSRIHAVNADTGGYPLMRCTHAHRERSKFEQDRTASSEGRRTMMGAWGEVEVGGGCTSPPAM